MAGRNLDEIIKALPPERQARIAARSAQLMEEYDTLQQLRKALTVTQEDLAKKLGVAQENISRLEQRSDLLLSTLARTIAALGGKLDLTVRFADRPPVSLSKLVDATLLPESIRAGAPARAAKRRAVIKKKPPHPSRPRRKPRAKTTATRA